MKNLRVLGSVGEPIAAEVWKWYVEVVGKEEAHVVDVREPSPFSVKDGKHD
jgi:acetyl-CoA synthetase